MEVFIQFADENQKFLVLGKARSLCRITASVREQLQYWFLPFNNECHNAFTDWLEDHGIEYENV